MRDNSSHPGLAAQLARHDVEQLLDVALDNALRYAGTGTTVTVSTVHSGDTVDLVVSDDGPGLPDEDLSRAAARFWRGRDDGGGTGLRLAIAAEVAAGHGGTVGSRKHRRVDSWSASAYLWPVIRRVDQTTTDRNMPSHIHSRDGGVGRGMHAERDERSVASGGRRPGGLYLAFAEILAKQMKARYPNITVEVLPTEGTVENLSRLRSGDVDMGLALVDVAERDCATGPADTTPQAVARVYENYLQVIVREGAAVQQISDLQSKRVSIGPRGSGAAVTSQVLFEAAELHLRVDMLNYRLRDGLPGSRTVTSTPWSGPAGCPHLRLPSWIPKCPSGCSTSARWPYR